MKETSIAALSQMQGAFRDNFLHDAAKFNPFRWEGAFH